MEQAIYEDSGKCVSPMKKIKPVLDQKMTAPRNLEKGIENKTQNSPSDFII